MNWLCPICGLKEFQYGTSPCKLKFCQNKPNSTGSWYINEDKIRCEQEAYGIMESEKEVRGVGISEIANMDEQGGM